MSRDAEIKKSIDLSRCDWCGWPLAKSVAEGCVAENCSMRPMPELTERGEMRQEIRFLRAVLEEIGEQGVDAESGVPYTAETLGGLSKQRLTRVIQDLTAKAREAVEPEEPPTIDIMEAVKASLAQGSKP